MGDGNGHNYRKGRFFAPAPSRLPVRFPLHVSTRAAATRGEVSLGDLPLFGKRLGDLREAGLLPEAVSFQAGTRPARRHRLRRLQQRHHPAGPHDHRHGLPREVLPVRSAQGSRDGAGWRRHRVPLDDPADPARHDPARPAGLRECLQSHLGQPAGAPRHASPGLRSPDAPVARLLRPLPVRPAPLPRPQRHADGAGVAGLDRRGTGQAAPHRDRRDRRAASDRLEVLPLRIRPIPPLPAAGYHLRSPRPQGRACRAERGRGDGGDPPGVLRRHPRHQVFRAGGLPAPAL